MESVASHPEQGRIQEFLIWGVPGFSRKCEVNLREIFGSRQQKLLLKGADGVFGGLPQKNKLRFQALKSVIWWILEMVLLWKMEKA